MLFRSRDPFMAGEPLSAEAASQRFEKSIREDGSLSVRTKAIVEYHGWCISEYNAVTPLIATKKGHLPNGWFLREANVYPMAIVMGGEFEMTVFGDGMDSLKHLCDQADEDYEEAKSKMDELATEVSHRLIAPLRPSEMKDPYWECARSTMEFPDLDDVAHGYVVRRADCGSCPHRPYCRRKDKEKKEGK